MALQTYPLLPLRDIVVFPHMIVPLFVGRDKSVLALEEVMKSDKQIMLVSQKDAAKDEPLQEDIQKVGTIGTVLQLLKLPDGTVKVLVEGGPRAEVVNFLENENFFQVLALEIEESLSNPDEIEALSRTASEIFENYAKLNKKIPPEVIATVNQIEDDPSKLADTIASHLAVKLEEKQHLLEIPSVGERLERICSLMDGEIGVLQVEKKVRGRVKRSMEKTQREYYLNEQMKAIQKELGEGDDGRDENADIEEKIKDTKLSIEAKEKADSELKKIKKYESNVCRGYGS